MIKKFFHSPKFVLFNALSIVIVSAITVFALPHQLKFAIFASIPMALITCIFAGLFVLHLVVNWINAKIGNKNGPEKTKNTPAPELKQNTSKTNEQSNSPKQENSTDLSQKTNISFKDEELITKKIFRYSVFALLNISLIAIFSIAILFFAYNKQLGMGILALALPTALNVCILAGLFVLHLIVNLIDAKIGNKNGPEKTKNTPAPELEQNNSKTVDKDSKEIDVVPSLNNKHVEGEKGPSSFTDNSTKTNNNPVPVSSSTGIYN